MPKNQNKTVASSASAENFIASLDDKQQAQDSRVLLEIFGLITGKKPVMWGSAIIGFGTITLKYASGRDVEWMQVGYSPRKGKITLYVTFDAAKLTSQFPNLGKYKIGKGCIYITRLSDVDMNELKKLIKTAYKSGYEQPSREDGKEQALEL